MDIFFVNRLNHESNFSDQPFYFNKVCIYNLIIIQKKNGNYTREAVGAFIVFYSREK